MSLVRVRLVPKQTPNADAVEEKIEVPDEVISDVRQTRTWTAAARFLNPYVPTDQFMVNYYLEK